MSELAPLRRPLRPEDVLKPKQAAELLGLPVSTLYDLARRGDVPCAKLGRTYRFVRPDLEERLRGG